MANKSEDHLVQCPFYTKNTNMMIACEGFEKGMRQHLWFDSHAAMVDFKKRHCRRKDYLSCPLAVLANRKWENEE